MPPSIQKGYSSDGSSNIEQIMVVVPLQCMTSHGGEAVFGD